MTPVFNMLFSFTADNIHSQSLKNTDFLFIIIGQSQSRWNTNFQVSTYIYSQLVKGLVFY